MIPVLNNEIKKDPDLEGFAEDELKTILLKMRIFELGLSVMVANDTLPKDYETQDLMAILSSAADDVILSAMLKKINLNEN